MLQPLDILTVKPPSRQCLIFSLQSASAPCTHSTLWHYLPLVSDIHRNTLFYHFLFFFFFFFFTPGRCAVSYMLSLSDSVTSLLPFVEPRNQREHDNLKLAKSSVSSWYAAVLLLQLLQSEWMWHTVHSQKFLWDENFVLLMRMGGEISKNFLLTKNFWLYSTMYFLRYSLPYLDIESA